MQWHQLDNMQSAPCSRQTTTPTPHHSIFTGRMLVLTPDQQRQSTEGTNNTSIQLVYTMRVSEINKRKKTTNKQDKNQGTVDNEGSIFTH